MSQEVKSQTLAHASFIQHLVAERACTVRSESSITSKAQHNSSGTDDPLAEEPIEGGPKTSEVSVDEVPSSKLLNEIHISPDLSPDQQHAVKQVVLSNSTVFGLDGRLGNYEGQIDMPMKPDAQGPFLS